MTSQRLDTRGGLTSAQAAARHAAVGPNLVPAARRRSALHRAGRQLADPMLLLLLAAAVLTTWQRDAADTVVILAVVVVNTAVGVAQELRAEHAVAALRDMAAPRARVVRDGTVTGLPAADVVPGDLVVLEAGDVVPADATVVEAHQVVADESAVTGESVGVDKAPGDPVLAGTTLVRGRGTAEVSATGASSTLGQIAAMVTAARPGPTPLQRRLGRLGRHLALAAVAAGALVMVLGVARGLRWQDAALQAVSLAVAAVPESLPAVVTLSLALGARRMAGHSAIPRELRAVETLGSVTLLATDKTGTLTENQMVVTAAWTPAATYDVAGEGYAPSGTVGRTAGRSDDAGLRRLAVDGALCNDADLERTASGWRALGDPTEAAMVAFAGRAGVDVGAIRRDLPRTAELPFESARGWMLTSHTRPDGGQPLRIVKGGPEAVLGRVVEDALVEAAEAWSRQQARMGRRVLAVAESEPGHVDLDEGLPQLVLVGLVAMADPPRRGVPAVVTALRGAGIRLAVMTGDQPATAAAVARQVGLTGRVVDVSAPPAGGVDAADGTVYSRVRPADKLALVRRWQESGEVVAVTGDGVNDGPALRRADIGVAMGEGGTEVARQAADLVLTDDRLETVVHAVAEGRRIQDNLRRFLGYALAGGLAEVLYVLLAPFAGLRVPLLPGQILWINMLTHGLPGVAMGAEPQSDDVLRRPPLPRSAGVLDRDVVRRVLGVGSLIFAATLVAALLAHRSGADWQTSAFLVLGLAQLGVALASRDRGAARRGAFLTVAVAVAALLMVAAVELPILRELLRTTSPGTATWLVAAGLAAVPGLGLRALRLLGGRR